MKAHEIIKEFLDKAGIPNKLDEKEEKVEFEVDGCKVNVHKHLYTQGYSLSSECLLDSERRKYVSSKAEIIQGFTIRLNKFKHEDGYFGLHGMSVDSALNAGSLNIRVPLKKEPEETGTWSIKCEEFVGCTVKKHE